MASDAREHLDGLLGRVDSLTVRIRDLVAPLDGEARVWQPAPEAWSIAHCCDHLDRTADHYHAELRTLLAAEHPAGDGRFRPSRFGRWFVRAVGPGGRAVRAPRSVRPTGAVAAEAPDRFLLRLAELRQMVETVRDRSLDLQRLRLRMLIPILTTQLGVILTLLVAHGERHIDQAERVARTEGFPGAAA